MDRNDKKENDEDEESMVFVFIFIKVFFVVLFYLLCLSYIFC